MDFNQLQESYLSALSGSLSFPASFEALSLFFLVGSGNEIEAEVPWCPSKQPLQDDVLATKYTGESYNNEAFLERLSKEFGLMKTRNSTYEIYVCMKSCKSSKNTGILHGIGCFYQQTRFYVNKSSG